MEYPITVFYFSYAETMHSGCSKSHAYFEPILVLYFSIVELGSGCGSVGRAVASDTRGPPFESSLRQTLCFCQLYWKVENKEKEAGKKSLWHQVPASGANSAWLRFESTTHSDSWFIKIKERRRRMQLERWFEIKFLARTRSVKSFLVFNFHIRWNRQTIWLIF